MEEMPADWTSPDVAMFDAQNRRLDRLLTFLQTSIVAVKSAAMTGKGTSPEVQAAYEHAVVAALQAVDHLAMEMVEF